MGLGRHLDEGPSFYLPGCSLPRLPLVSESGERLSLGLVEIGCRPKGKMGQLGEKKELLCKYWADTYRKGFGVEWMPELYRGIGHYKRGQRLSLSQRRYEVDLSIVSLYLSDEMLKGLTNQERGLLYRAVKKERRPFLMDILRESDAEGLHRLITSSRRPAYAHLRGRLAELFVMKEIEAARSDDVFFVRNGDLRVFNRRYPVGTEVDGILVFYGEEKLVDLVEGLRRRDHLRVRDRWHESAA